MFTNLKSRPLLNRKTGKPISDNELIKEALKKIDKYTETTGMAAPIDTKFVEWLKEAKVAIENGINIVAHKNKTITKLVPDYSIITDNTERYQRKNHKKYKEILI